MEALGATLIIFFLTTSFFPAYESKMLIGLPQSRGHQSTPKASLPL